MSPTAKSENTKPEILVRKFLHSAGLRFRLHQKIGNVKPDIILKRWNTCIFIHGCFWHQHEGCKLAYIPKSNTDFWTTKFQKNRARDQRNIEHLKTMNWKIGVIWECAVRQGLIEKTDFKKLIVNSDFWEIGIQ